MELNPITLAFGGFFIFCTIVLLIAQFIAYRWATKLEDEFEEGEEGKELTSIIRRFLRLIVIGQAMGSSVILLYAVLPEERLLRATLVLAAQLTVVVASVLVLYRVRALSARNGGS